MRATGKGRFSGRGLGRSHWLALDEVFWGRDREYDRRGAPDILIDEQDVYWTTCTFQVDLVFLLPIQALQEKERVYLWNNIETDITASKTTLE